MWASDTKSHPSTDVDQHGQRKHLAGRSADVPGYAPHIPEAFHPVNQRVVHPQAIGRSDMGVKPSGGGLDENVHVPDTLPAGKGMLSEREAGGASSMVSEGKKPSGVDSLMSSADTKPFGKVPSPPVHQSNGFKDNPNGQHSRAEGPVTTGSHAITESATAMRTDVNATRDPLEPDATKRKQNTASTRYSQSRLWPSTKVIHVVGFSAGIALVLLVYHRPWRSSS